MNKHSEDKTQNAVSEKKIFLLHLGIYIIVNLFLFIINVLTLEANGGEWWFYYPIMAWAIGLAIHFFYAFGPIGTQEIIDKWGDEMNETETTQNRGANTKALPSDRRRMGEDLELRDLKKEKEPIYRDDDFV